MRPSLLKAFHLLPPSGRNLVASLRGLELRRWRYGSETERLVREALERDHWSQKEWASWQKKRLGEVLHRAATKVPYYREFWANRKRQGDLRPWEDLGNWPVLNKETVRATPTAFLADDCDPRRMFCDQTSGTSGTPLKIWLGRDAVQAWYAIFEARLRRWNGVSRHERWAIIGGQQVVSGTARKPPFWVHNRPMNQLYLSANHISRVHARDYWRALEDFGATHLVTYSTSGAALAYEFAEMDLKCSSLKVVITNAEPLLASQRELMEKTLSPFVRESYGMAEAVAGASECNHGHLHLWPEAGFVEVINDESDTPLFHDGVGRLVCTSLINLDMPMVRYAVGDRSSEPQWNHQCPCSRTLPRFQRIEGRSNDLLTTKDGRKVFWINPVFYGLPVTEAQVLQETIDEFSVRLVPAPGFSNETEATITARLRDRLGNVGVRIHQVHVIPRGPNGKFKAVVSLLDKSLTA